MRIGAYDLSSQMNIYTKLSAHTVKQVESTDISRSVNKTKDSAVDVTLNVDGRDYPSASSIYKKYSSDGIVLNKDNTGLDDFSLISAKDDMIVSRKKPVDDLNINGIDSTNYKEIISDEEMDSFLKKAFKLI